MTTSEGQLLRVGERLGNLRLERLIGEGGMGVLYEARHVLLDRPQAVKLLRPALAADPTTYARFQREARVAASLDSDHVVPVRDFGNASDGTPYFVMDLLEGVDLATLLSTQAPLEAVRAADLMLHACRGLKVAHEHSPPIVHRDLKPANLFVCRRDDGTEVLKILDFGIAKFLDSRSTDSIDSMTRTGVVMGTPHYMSPEQAEGVGPVDPRTDIYALGVILYEALSGRKAHPGSSYNEVISHILLRKPIPVESLRPDLPTMLVAIVRRAMEFDVSLRFQTVAELADALSRFRSGSADPLAVRIAASTARPPQPPSAPTVSSELTAVANAVRPKRRSVGLRVLGLLAGLAVLVCVARVLFLRASPMKLSVHLEVVITANHGFALATSPPSGSSSRRPCREDRETRDGGACAFDQEQPIRPELP